MYIPKHFLVEGQKAIYEFIESNCFSILFSTHEGMPFATHLPLLLNQEKGFLYGHFATSNSHWVDMDQQEVMVVFQGPHT